MHAPRFDRILLCALVATSLLACSQDKDEPCQVDGDCDDGLICVRARRSDRGTCEDPGADAGAAGSGGAAGQEPPLPPDEEDAGQEPDSGASGAGGASGDAGLPAAGSAADAGADAGDAGDPLGEDAGG